ncbi:caspase family protein [Streptomyces sp. NPDC002054]|uniref:caspase, EACC1-associated type n=1 Tax=Streptomyces sp. NPDC002054 TaxID=3154663 RepID=UPI003333ADA9
MELADPHGSYAVLIGSTRYEDPALEDLPAVAANLEDLGRLLEDPTVWGLPPEHCTRLVDPSSPAVLLDAVRAAAQRATDTLLVYYAGHGLVAPEVDGLLLALPSSDPERPYSSVDFASLRREVLGAGRRVNRMVILDCCYSGQALTGGMSGSVTMAEQARIAGTYLLTACAANRQALSPPGEAHTAFTGELIRVLDQGLAGAGPLIGTPDLYDHLLGELRAKERPLPQQRLSNTGRTLAIARNRHGTHGRLSASAADAPARAVPERLREMLRAQPRLIAEHAARLRVTDPAAAGELLALAAGTRPAQEAAALVCLLHEQGRVDEADTVLHTIGAERAPLDLASIVPALHAMDDEEDVGRLLSAVAVRRTPEDIAGTVRLLHENGHGNGADADFLLTAAIGTLRTTEAVLGLAGAMWSAQLDDQANLVLRAPSVSSPQETARLADALRSIGRVEEALDLYLQILPVVTQDPAALVRVLRVADEAGRAAEGLVRTAVEAAPAVRDLAGLCDALWTAGMADRAWQTLSFASGRLATEDIVTLAELLHAQGHDDAVLHLFGQAALHHPVAATPELVAALRTMGRPLDAGALLADAANRPTEQVAELLALLYDQGAVRDRARVWDALPEGLVERGRLLRLLHTAHRRPCGDLMDGLCRLPGEEFTGALRTLRENGEHDAANLLLRRLAQTAPKQAVEYQDPFRFQQMTLADRIMLHALLAAFGGWVGVEPSRNVVEILVASERRSLDQRVAAMAALSEAGLSGRVEELLADSTRHQQHAEVVRLLGHLEARGLTAAARAVVRGAEWMHAELYRDFVRAIEQAGLRDLAVYAVECAPDRLTVAQRRKLAEILGVPAPDVPDGDPTVLPPAPQRLRDRLRRR